MQAMNHLYYGDNLTVPRESIKGESVDFEFEKSALSLINAQPGNLSKKGADRRIDGNINFAKTSRAIVSVKANSTSSP